MAKYIKRTADDEDADCQRCDNNDVSDTFCMNCCGPNTGWRGYFRIEEVEEEDHGEIDE